MSNAGWHPDPHAPHQNRYFDGTTWTEHVAPIAHAAPAYAAPTYAVAPQVMAIQQTTVVNQAAPKSVGVALLLTFFFGPFGMFYSTVLGGAVMLALDLVLGLVTFGLWFIVAWPIQMVWAAIAASNSRSGMVGVSNQVVAPMPQQYAPQPQYTMPQQLPAPQPPPAYLPPAQPQYVAPAPHTVADSIERQLPIATTSYEAPTSQGPPPWPGTPG